jgi:hypothetical protein
MLLDSNDDLKRFLEFRVMFLEKDCLIIGKARSFFGIWGNI